MPGAGDAGQLANFDAYVDAHRGEFVRALEDLCRRPAISAQGAGIRETAAYVASLLQEAGAHSRLLETEGAPLVYGEAGAGDRTLLIYNHYDVQPPEPLDEWISPPFEPQLRDAKLYARGVADNRADLLARMLAVRTWQETIGPLPLRLRWLVEGEEEIGSPHLAPAVQRYRDLLTADGCLWECGGLDEEERFEIVCGCKGDYYADVWVEGPAYDLHSSLAAIVPNPAWRLVWALATLKSPDDRIAIDGFMERVRPPSPAEEALLERLPVAEDKMRAELGIPAFVNGLAGMDLKRKYLFEPTCTISGLTAGYSGEGAKTVMPARASAKLDIRLVPGLDPATVHGLLRAHLDRRGFADVGVRQTDGGLRPVRSDPDSIVVAAAIAAARPLYGEPVVSPTTAGSGPMDSIGEGLGLPMVAAGGIGYPGCRAHAPNEHIRVDDYIAGIKYIARLFVSFATMGR
jgi:acetylornithine deacetylase/succinyl-diaminopimelate desuccinylase-like protein